MWQSGKIIPVTIFEWDVLADVKKDACLLFRNSVLKMACYMEQVSLCELRVIPFTCAKKLRRSRVANISQIHVYIIT